MDMDTTLRADTDTMPTRKARLARIAATFVAVLAALAAWSPPALASSNFRLGQSSSEDPISGEAQTVAVCSLFLGPRGDVPAGQFLL